MKQMISLLFCLLLLPCLMLPVSAREAPVITDQEQLLTDQEIYDLMADIQALEEEYGIDILLVTTGSYAGKSAQEYADDFYDRYGEENGLLFLLSMTQREWYISTAGTMIYALTDFGIQQLGEGSAVFFGENRIYEGFAYFLDSLPAYLDAFESGGPVDGWADYGDGYYHGGREETVYYDTPAAPNFLISLVIGLAAALVSVLVMRASLNTRRQQRGAGSYLTPGSYHVSRHQDLFLYSNVSKTRRQQNASGGGGSSVHRSSGGRRHGGGGGRF